jgi:hypothetical protein
LRHSARDPAVLLPFLGLHDTAMILTPWGFLASCSAGAAEAAVAASAIPADPRNTRLVKSSDIAILLVVYTDQVAP